MTKRTHLGFLGALAFALALPCVSQAGPLSVCGDAMLDMPPESCDDGNTVPGDGCSADCIPEVCGDAILEPVTEQCDDGNTDPGDGCDGECNCEAEICGDGVVGCTEDCDDGNTIDDDECPNDCMLDVVACQEGDEGKPAQKCVTALNKAWGGVIKATNKAAGKCVKDISKGRVTVSFADCSGQADLGKAFQKTTKAKTGKCDGKFEGDMCGYSADSQAINAAGRDPILAAHYDLLGGDVANIIPKDRKIQAKCQQEVQKGLIKYLDGLSADANKQKKDCVKGTKTCTEAATDSDDLATAMIAEGKKQTKALSKWNTKVGKKCSDTAAIATDFPGICASSATYTELVACSARRAMCRFCASLNDADRLSIDCAAYSNDPFLCDPKPSECGDGVVDPDEECDNGTTADDATCNGDCTLPDGMCGDGVIDPGEDCDDGNTDECDGCGSDCLFDASSCGDGLIQCEEQCDDGNTIDDDLCTNACLHNPTCGDMVVTPPEECDDGNSIDDDDCSNLCEFTSICGDGVVGPPETCDDGNTVPGDGCDENCVSEAVCGDGTTEPPEECDDMNTIDDDACRNDCTLPVCGDGDVGGSEECDDGNSIDDDGCPNDCMVLTLSVVGQTQADEGESVIIQIVTDEAIAVGSTDIDLNWDAAGIDATAAATSVLSTFTSNIDNVARRVRTGSASTGADMIPAGATLFEVTFTATAAGTYELFVTDADGTPPDDLAGPVPPIPPVSIPYVSVLHTLTVVPVP
jgi:cysteine-rich repeat protein